MKGKRMRIRSSIVLATGMLLYLVTANGACSSSESGSYCEALTGRYRECGLLTEGEYHGCADLDDAAERCERECIDGATCADLTELLCSSQLSSVELCFDQCTAQDSFRCADGSRFSVSSRCNGADDCADGSDEVGCPDSTLTFACRNTPDEVPFSDRCDGNKDCPDGSDESRCLSRQTFACADGTKEISVDAQCNGIEDCADGSDEGAGCARVQCAKGG